YAFIVLAVFSVTGCDKGKKLDKLSPKEVVELYYQAKDDGDIEILQQITYFSSDVPEAQKRTKITTSGADEKTVKRMVGAKIKAEYEKMLDDDTAEVGVVIFMGIPGWKKRVPFQQVILKREDNIWKFSNSKYEFTEDQLIEKIRENPYNASAIYHLGRKYQSENQAKANRYYRKYRELEPKGFWISKELKNQLERYENVERRENELLGRLQYIPEKSPDRASVYWTLGQLFIEHGEYEKAKTYFAKAEEILKWESNPNSIYIQRFNNAKKALELAVKGESFDILKELESEGVYK
ncbi:MAG: tetratricopeptide repeat protein, partial [Planctomycetota bacterium]